MNYVKFGAISLKFDILSSTDLIVTVQIYLEFHGSWLTRLLYSQNIQRGPPLVGASWK